MGHGPCACVWPDDLLGIVYVPLATLEPNATQRRSFPIRPPTGAAEHGIHARAQDAPASGGGELLLEFVYMLSPAAVAATCDAAPVVDASTGTPRGSSGAEPTRLTLVSDHAAHGTQQPAPDRATGSSDSALAHAAADRDREQGAAMPLSEAPAASVVLITAVSCDADASARAAVPKDAAGHSTVPTDDAAACTPATLAGEPSDGIALGEQLVLPLPLPLPLKTTSPAATLDEFLNDAVAFSYLMEFMSAEHDSALLQFWVSAGEYRQRMTALVAQSGYTAEFTQACQQEAFNLFTMYFASGAPLPVRLEREILGHLNATLGDHSSAPGIDCFDEARGAAYHRLQEHYFPRFRRSHLYANYCNDRHRMSRAAGHADGDGATTWLSPRTAPPPSPRPVADTGGAGHGAALVAPASSGNDGMPVPVPAHSARATTTTEASADDVVDPGRNPIGVAIAMCREQQLILDELIEHVSCLCAALLRFRAFLALAGCLSSAYRRCKPDTCRICARCISKRSTLMRSSRNC